MYNIVCSVHVHDCRRLSWNWCICDCTIIAMDTVTVHSALVLSLCDVQYILYICCRKSTWRSPSFPRCREASYCRSRYRKFTHSPMMTGAAQSRGAAWGEGSGRSDRSPAHHFSPPTVQHPPQERQMRERREQTANSKSKLWRKCTKRRTVHSCLAHLTDPLSDRLTLRRVLPSLTMAQPPSVRARRCAHWRSNLWSLVREQQSRQEEGWAPIRKRGRGVW